MKAARALLVLSLLPGLAAAQWTSNAALNTSVCGHAGDQAVPKCAATGDGRTWVGWFDQASGNYDVYVQLLDANGNELLAHDGLLVSANPQSTSLVDWDLIADAQGNCVLAFTDTRAGSDLDVYAYRISPAGQFLWGANGVVLSNNADYEVNPKLIQTSDGAFVCAWARLPTGTQGSIRVQKLDAAGVPQYAAEGFAITGTASEHPAFCDLVPAPGGAYIVQWLRDITQFNSPRHIRAQKFDAAGNALWAAPVAVYDFNSVPIGYQPIVQPDGAGGALFAWHRSSGTTYDSLVQHLDANGTELFAHNGVLVSTEANRGKFDPSLAWLPASGEMVVAFDKRNAGQSQWALCAQRISAAGARLWTDNGIELMPLDGVAKSFERCLPFGNGALVFCFEQPTALPQYHVLGFRLDASGASQWGAGPLFVSSNNSSKDDVEAVIDGSGMARLVWHDERNDGGDVFAQNVNPDGTLGIPVTCTSSTYCVGAPNSAGPGAAIAFSGGTSVALNDFTLTASGCPANVNAYFIYGSTQVQLPLGDGFRCVGGSIFRLRPAQSTGAGGVVARLVDFTQPPAGSGPGLIAPGSTWNFQLYYRDVGGPLGTGFNLSNALSVGFCP